MDKFITKLDVEDAGSEVADVCRTISQDVADHTGKTRKAARAALDAVGDDRERAYTLLMSELAFTVTEGLSCERQPLREDWTEWLGSMGFVCSPGAFNGFSNMAVSGKCREYLRMFALEPLEICIVSVPNDSHHLSIKLGWNQLEGVQASSDHTEQRLSVVSRLFDPGSIVVSMKDVLFSLFRSLHKPVAHPPKNSCCATSQGGRELPKELAVSYASNSQEIQTAKLVKAAESATVPVLPTASRFQSCRSIEMIGSGAFGAVHLVEHDGTRLAIKRIPEDAGHASREVRILRLMSHPFIVTFVDSFETTHRQGKKITHIVMEYLPENLHGRINGRALSPLDLRCFGFQLLRSLIYLHGMSIIHRDLKPENLLVAGRVLKLADFGSAKVLDDGPSSSYICSRWWRAPELVFGASQYTTSLDWWSAGCVFVEMMLGRPLFPGKSSWGQMYEYIRVLGTPSLAEIGSLIPQGNDQNRLAEQLAKLATLKRPARPLGEVLPAYRDHPEALELPARLLMYDPSDRLAPTGALALDFFAPIFQEQSLPVDILKFASQELCQLEPTTRKALELQQEPSTRRALELQQQRQKMVLQAAPVPSLANQVVKRPYAIDQKEARMGLWGSCKYAKDGSDQPIKRRRLGRKTPSSSMTPHAMSIDLKGGQMWTVQLPKPMDIG